MSWALRFSNWGTVGEDEMLETLHLITPEQ